MERTRESEVRVLPVRVGPVSCTVLSGGGQMLTPLSGGGGNIPHHLPEPTRVGEQDKTRTARGGEGPMRGKRAYFKQVAFYALPTVSGRGLRSLGVSGE